MALGVGAAAVGVDDWLLPLFHGREGDAAVAVGGVYAPREVPLAIPLVLAGCGKYGTVRRVGRDGVACRRTDARDLGVGRGLSCRRLVCRSARSDRLAVDGA